MVNNLKSGITHAIVANILWGTTFLATQHALIAWSPMTATVVRFTLASVLLAFGMKWFAIPVRFPATAGGWTALLATSILGFGLLYPLQATGLQTLSSGVSAILMLTSPLFLIAISALRRESISPKKWTGVTLGMVGGAVLIGAHTSISNAGIDLPGAALTLGAAICLASSTLTAKRALAEIDQLSLTLLSMVIGTAVLIPGTLTEPPAGSIASTSAWFAIVYLAVIGSILAFFLWNKAIAIGSPTLIACTMHIKTPVAVALGMALNHESMSISIFLGGILVALGVGIATTTFEKSREMGRP